MQPDFLFRISRHPVAVLIEQGPLFGRRRAPEFGNSGQVSGPVRPGLRTPPGRSVEALQTWLLPFCGHLR
jgi:hypothetical protein